MEYVDPDPQHQQIIAIVKKYVHALDAGNVREMAATMCAAEGQEYLDQFAEEDRDVYAVDVPEPALAVTNIEIKDAAARAKVLRENSGLVLDGPMYFGLEGDQWKICAANESKFTS